MLPIKIAAYSVLKSGKGATLSMPDDYIPEYAIKKAEEFRSVFLRKNPESAEDLKYRFFYDKGKACLEYTVIPKRRYTWSKPTWIGCIWSNCEGIIGNGKIRYTKAKKLADKAQWRMDQRRKSPEFGEIENVVMRVAAEYQYDYEEAYGIRVKYRNPDIKKAVCGGYSNAVAEAFQNNRWVAKVEKWSSSRGNHAWNVIVLKNGNKIYCDATWYQGNSIDDEGYVVAVPAQDPVDLTFDIDEFNSLGGAINTATGRLLAVHFGWGDAELEK